ncbi:hypothetical protein RN001_013706 [Aquatica leii]|uniref:Uncharacterized protein n=1 Tax=Aquatica leii TaxID=1421715 RepID=A0AAN7P2V7_9COLE|nr:hypothetical protein RN001_013706 [Aquatica leii]
MLVWNKLLERADATSKVLEKPELGIQTAVCLLESLINVMQVVEADDDYLDEADNLDESDHKSKSEQVGDDSDEENVLADEDENITCYIGKDGTTWKKKCPINQEDNK